jgi:hypothetical protein
MDVKIAATIVALLVLTSGTLLFADAGVPRLVLWAFVCLLWPPGLFGIYLTWKL